MARIVVGTSGWHYDSWRGPFYPPGLPIRAQLQYYASQFEAAELNGVFYRTPTVDTVRNWKKQTGKDFIFSWKASKFITHWKRLSENSVNSIKLMESRVSLIGDKAGPNTVSVAAALPDESRSAHKLFGIAAAEKALHF